MPDEKIARAASLPIADVIEAIAAGVIRAGQHRDLKDQLVSFDLTMGGRVYLAALKDQLGTRVQDVHIQDAGRPG